MHEPYENWKPEEHHYTSGMFLKSPISSSSTVFFNGGTNPPKTKEQLQDEQHIKIAKVLVVALIVLPFACLLLYVATKL